MFARACTLWCRISLYVRIKIITTRSCGEVCARPGATRCRRADAVWAALRARPASRAREHVTRPVTVPTGVSISLLSTPGTNRPSWAAA